MENIFKIMNERAKKLVEALKIERTRFEKDGQSTLEHDIAIEYLETGRTDEDPNEFELLDAAMNDFDILCSDYGA
jgi:hypothetical protein